MMHLVDEEKKLATLRKKALVDLSINDIRIIVSCFKAVAYQAQIDDEPYLDSDALELKCRLESFYDKLVKERSHNGHNGRS